MANRFPSPESGIINSFSHVQNQTMNQISFRPLSRGLSIPSAKLYTLSHVVVFPSPESGIINSFSKMLLRKHGNGCFRPLSRGLSIPSAYSKGFSRDN